MAVYELDGTMTVSGFSMVRNTNILRAFVLGICIILTSLHLYADSSAEESFSELTRDLKTITRAGSQYDVLLSSYATYDALTYALINPLNDEGVLRLVGELERNSESINRFIVTLVQVLDERPELRERIEKNLKKLQNHASFKKVSLPMIGLRSYTSALYIIGLTSVLYGFQSTYIDPSIAGSYSGAANIASQFFLLHFGLNLYAEWRNARVGIPAYLEQLRVRWRAGRNIRLITSIMNKISSLDPQLLSVARRLRTQYFDTSSSRAKKVVELSKEVSQSLYTAMNEQFHSTIRSGFVNNNIEFKETVANLSKVLTEHEKLEIQNVMMGTNAQPLSITTKVKVLEYEKRVFEILANEGFFSDSNLARALVLELAQAENLLLNTRIKQTKPILIVRINNALLAASTSIIGLIIAVGTQPSVIDYSMSPSVINFIRSHSSSLIQFTSLLTIPSIAGFWWGIAKYNSHGGKMKYSLTIEAIRKLRQTVEYAFSAHHNQSNSYIDTKVDLLQVHSLSDKLLDITIREFRFEHLEQNLNRTDSIHTEPYGWCGYLITN